MVDPLLPSDLFDVDASFHLVGPLLQIDQPNTDLRSVFDMLHQPEGRFSPTRFYPAMRVLHESAHAYQLLGSTLGSYLAQLNDILLLEFSAAATELGPRVLETMYDQMRRGCWTGAKRLSVLQELFPRIRLDNFNVPLSAERQLMVPTKATGDTFLQNFFTTHLVLARDKIEQEAILKIARDFLGHSRDKGSLILGWPVDPNEVEHTFNHQTWVSSHMLLENYARVQEFKWSAPYIDTRNAREDLFVHSMTKGSIEYSHLAISALHSLRETLSLPKIPSITDPFEATQHALRPRSGSEMRLDSVLMLAFELAIMTPISHECLPLLGPNLSLNDLLPINRWDRVIASFAKGKIPLPPIMDELIGDGEKAVAVLDEVCRALSWPTYSETVRRSIEYVPDGRGQVSSHLDQYRKAFMQMKIERSPFVPFESVLGELFRRKQGLTIRCGDALFRMFPASSDDAQASKDLAMYVLHLFYRVWYFGNNDVEPAAPWRRLQATAPFDKAIAELMAVLLQPGTAHP